MTQIEQIKAEIERLTEVTGYALSEYENGRRSAMYDIRKQLIEYINSLHAEQPGEELEYLATSLEETIGTSPHSRETIISYLQQAAQWQKEQMMKSAIDAKIVNDEMSGCVVDCEQGCLVLAPHRYPIGQKLKILILEDKQ